MSTFTVYAMYITDTVSRAAGCAMTVSGWLLSVFFFYDFVREFKGQDELNARLRRASKLSVVMDICGKVFTYYLVLTRQENHIPKFVLGLELPTTLIEGMIKWEHAKFIRVHKPRDEARCALLQQAEDVGPVDNVSSESNV